MAELRLADDGRTGARFGIATSGTSIHRWVHGGTAMELIRGIRESAPGDVLAVYSSDKGSRSDIPKWVAKAGHTLVGVYTREGYDEIIVEKTH